MKTRGKKGLSDFEFYVLFLVVTLFCGLTYIILECLFKIHNMGTYIFALYCVINVSLMFCIDERNE